tara:strand:+ start:5267 stop:5533 length:267 start_codon:yes stop_codon:yes gene_type:complete
MVDDQRIEDELSIDTKMEGVPRIFRSDLDNDFLRGIFDSIIRVRSEKQQLDLRRLDAVILERGRIDTLVNALRSQEVIDKGDKENKQD